MWWRTLIVFLAFVLIGAHFMRFGQNLIAASFALAPILLLIKHPFINHLLSATLVICAILVWGLSGYDYVQMRIAMDAPWLRLAAIMSAVALFTLSAAFCSQGIAKLRLLRSKSQFH
ncbi:MULTISPECIES: hypothetical protein [Shewanella]|uniref:hypothetical protein n=1 Tax=Shewanella TaxID=22 RepID=UPI00048DD484|nr:MULTISPECIES: hypothetical protein [Shewanella]QLE85131.1 hypothetical protein FLM48_08535 [Shewanella sp. Scap07]